MNKVTCKLLLLVVSLIMFLHTTGHSQGTSYQPNGDPKKWNFELNPFLWLPMVSGEIQSDKLTEETNIPAVDILSNLKMAFMMNAEVSRGKFFAAPTYVYTKLGTEETVWTSESGDNTVSVNPDLKMNIVEFVAGGRFRLGKKFILDPFGGFRYVNYHVYGSVNKLHDTVDFNDQVDFWDPVIGLQVHYFPAPRVPVILKTDIGGFGVGSKFSWTASLYSGYTVSPVIDIVAGFAAFGCKFEEEGPLGNTASLTTVMYGFNLGIKIHIPGRGKDPAVFKKAK